RSPRGVGQKGRISANEAADQVNRAIKSPEVAAWACVKPGRPQSGFGRHKPGIRRAVEQQAHDQSRSRPNGSTHIVRRVVLVFPAVWGVQERAKQMQSPEGCEILEVGGEPLDRDGDQEEVN